MKSLTFYYAIPLLQGIILGFPAKGPKDSQRGVKNPTTGSLIESKEAKDWDSEKEE